MDVFALSAKLGLNTSEFSSGLKKSESKFKSFGTKLGSAAKKVAKVGAAAFAAVGAAAVGFAKASIDTGKEFDSAMSQVAATMGMTSSDIENDINGAGKTFAALSAKAREMGAETNFSATQAAEGLNILAMSGYSAKDSMGMIEDVLHLAAAGSMDMASAASYVSQAMKGFGDSSKGAGYYADLMAKGATLANTNVQQLGEALGSGAAAGKTYGQTAESITLALLRLAEQGETGAAAGTALNATMKNLYAPTDQAAKAMKELKVSAYNADGSARDLNDVVNDLQKSTADMTAEQRAATLQTIFGIQGFDAYNKMVATSAKKQDEWKKSLKGSTGEAAKQYETMTDNLQGDIDKFNSALDETKITIAEKMMPTIRSSVQGVTRWVTKFSTAFKKGGISKASKVLSSFISSISEKLTTGIPTLLSVGWDLAKGLVEGIWNGIKKIKWPSWKDIKKTVTKLWEGIKKGVSEFGGLIFGKNKKGKVKWPTWKDVEKFAKKAWEGIKEGVSFLGGLIFGKNKKGEVKWPTWEDVKKFATDAWENIKSGVNTLGGLIFGKTKKGKVKWPTWKDVKKFATDAWDKIKAGVDTLGGLIFGKTKKGKVKWPKWDDVKKAAENAWSLIKTGAAQIADWAGGIVFGRAEDGSVAWPTWDDVKKAATDAWEKIKEKAAELSGLVFGDGQSIIDGVTQFFENARVSIEHIDWSGLGSAIYGLITAPFDFIVSFFSEIFSGGKDEAEGLDWSGLGKSIVNLVKSGLTGLARMVVGMFKKAWVKSTAVWTAIGTWFTNNVVTPVVTTFVGIGDSIKGKFDEAYTLVKSVFDGVQDWFKTNVFDQIKLAFRSTVIWFGAKFQDAYSAIKNAYKGVEKWFTDNVVQPIKNAFKSIVLFFSNTFTKAYRAVKRVFANVKKWFTDNVVTPITTAINGILAPFQSVVDTISGWLGKKEDKTITVTTRHVSVYSTVRNYVDKRQSGQETTAEEDAEFDEAFENWHRQAKGNWNVPYDNYPSMLHRNEMVLTASQARQYREGNNNGNINTAALVSSIVGAVKEGMRNAQVNAYLDGREVTDNVSRRMANQVKAMRYAT